MVFFNANRSISVYCAFCSGVPSLCLQVHTFYEAVGYMIGAQTDQAVQELLIEKYMLLPNQVWDSIIQQATKVRTAAVNYLRSGPFVVQGHHVFICKSGPFATECGHFEGRRNGAATWQHPEDQRQSL